MSRRLSPLPHFTGLLVLGAALVAVFLSASRSIAGEWFIFPLDDTYIHLRLADNWLRGQGFVINPGEIASPESSALWGALLCLVALAGSPLIPSAMALSVLCHLALGPLAWLVLHRLTRDRTIALLGAATVLCSGRLVWAAGSGMEIPLAAALGLTTLWLDLRRPRRGFSLAVAVAGGLATLARPEMALLVASIALARWLQTRRIGPWIEAALAAAIFLIYPLMHFAKTGHLLPPTLSARMALFDEPRLVFLRHQISLWFLDESPLLTILILPAGLAVALRHRRQMSALWIWIAAHLAVSLVVFHVSYHHTRYMIPLIPSAVIAVVAAMPHLARLLRWRPILAGRLLALALLASACSTLPHWWAIYRDNTSNVFDQQITVARWIDANVPPDATLAVNDIGAHTLFTDRRVVDLAGLATPELLPLIMDSPIRSGQADAALADEIVARGCDWVIFFPRWYPELAKRSDLLETVEEFRLSHNTICGDSLVRVCRVRIGGDRQ
jgi:hypothetical protein